jgi:hypothetical protein
MLIIKNWHTFLDFVENLESSNINYQLFATKELSDNSDAPYAGFPTAIDFACLLITGNLTVLYSETRTFEFPYNYGDMLAESKELKISMFVKKIEIDELGNPVIS